MLRSLLCAAVFLGFSSALAASTVTLPACASAIELIYFNYGLRGDVNVAPRYKLEPHVARAMRAVLEDYSGRKGEVPLLFAEPSFLKDAEGLWWSLMRTYRGHSWFGPPNADPVVLTPWPGGDGNTFRLESDGAVFRFRQRAQTGTIRLSYNADRLSYVMGLNSSLVTRLAVVNNIQGVASEWKEGRSLGKATAAEIDRMVNAGEIDEASFSDASAFEWLVNHSRCVTSRFVVTPEKRVVVIDRPCCLNCTTNEPFTDKDTFYLGWTLPQKYTRDFIAKLRAIDRDAVNQAIQLDLADAETAALLFRREVILKDVELRGESVFIP